MTLNLLTQPGGVCGNCNTRDGACPRCGTYWHGGTGYRLVWPESGSERFVKHVREHLESLGLPPDMLSIR